MAKTLLRRKTVLENGIIIKKWYCTKNIKKANPTFTINEGWNIQNESDCTPPCPGPKSSGYYECIGGQCIYIPY